jgi:hypothetical protein
VWFLLLAVVVMATSSSKSTVPAAKRIRIGAFQYRDATSTALRTSTPAVAFVADESDAADDGPSGVSCALASTAATASVTSSSVNVKQLGNEQFEMRFDAEPTRFGALLGQGGRIKRQLEAETGGSFVIPKSSIFFYFFFFFCNLLGVIKTFLGFPSLYCEDLKKIQQLSLIRQDFSVLHAQTSYFF